MSRVGQNHIYIRCKYGISGWEITRYTVISSVYIRFWPTLFMSHESKVRTPKRGAESVVLSCAPGSDSVHQDQTVCTRIRQCAPGSDGVHQDQTVCTRIRWCAPGSDGVHQDQTVCTRIRWCVAEAQSALRQCTEVESVASMHRAHCVNALRRKVLC